VILGNCIGAGDNGTASRYARQFLILAVGGALFVGAIVLLTSGPVLTLYRISAEAHFYTSRVLAVVAGGLLLKSANTVMIVGILRSGGDTRFAMLADTFPLWLIGVPLALIGAFVFHLPVYWVAVLVFADEATKFSFALWRVISGRWINTVVYSTS
jgi:Na+-driven multidrug efflux pump